MPNVRCRSTERFATGVLTANELNRIDKAPRFVFSNACESGMTPERADEGNLAMGPTFAESFFERGVANFVCSAWKVDDEAARDFALELYAALLGFSLAWSELGDRRVYTFRMNNEPKPMHAALLQARTAIHAPGSKARPDAGLRTWGAYQHYGDPYFQLFNPKLLQDRTPLSVAAGSSDHVSSGPPCRGSSKEKPNRALRSYPRMGAS